MSRRRTPHLNAARRRARKATLARRDGDACTYCRRRFTDLRAATLDHVVPYSLLRTWSAAHLVLACHDCNDVKANRLPLSIALLLLAVVGSARESESVDYRTLARLAHTAQSAARSVSELPVRARLHVCASAVRTHCQKGA